MKNIRSFLLTAVALAAVAFFAPAVCHAQAAAAPVAAPVVVSTPKAAPAPVAAPWYVSVLTGENIAWAFSLITGIVAVFKHNDLTKSQKALRAVIVGVEQATQLPAVQAEAGKIKAAIQSYAVSHGIQTELDTLVQDITGQLLPAPTAAVAQAAPAPAASPAAPAV